MSHSRSTNNRGTSFPTQAGRLNRAGPKPAGAALLPAVVAALALVAVALKVEAGGDETLQKCRQLQAEIRRYEELRRDGGSGKQMDAWKRARRQKQGEFRALGCHYRHRELD